MHPLYDRYSAVHVQEQSFSQVSASVWVPVSEQVSASVSEQVCARVSVPVSGDDDVSAAAEVPVSGDDDVSAAEEAAPDDGDDAPEQAEADVLRHDEFYSHHVLVVRIPAMPLTAPSKALRVFFCFSCVFAFLRH